MPYRKKKPKTDTGPEEEHIEIDFDRIFLIGRIRLGLTQEEIERMTFGKWADIHHAYREIHNFEAKGGLYSDIEDEVKKYQAEHQPVTSLLAL